MELEQNALFGCFGPTRTLPEAAVDERVATFDAPGVLIGAPRAPTQGGRAPLHVGEHTVVSMLGYTLDPALHGYSDSARIIKEFQGGWRRGRNGVYACVVYDRQRHRLALLADTLGFAPLYYRKAGELWLFASNPRLLALASDQPDRLAWLSLLQLGCIVGERTLTQDVHRLKAGHSLVIEPDGCREVELDSFAALPAGEMPGNEASVDAVEHEFQSSMDRLLAFDDRLRILPLSSGHDSRRILASLVHREEPFSAHTVRVFQKGHRDLDASFASEMAQHFGFQHEIVELPEPRQFALDDRLRRILVDGESRMHSWAVALMRRLPSDRPSLFLDGVLGDILGNPGFRMPGMYDDNEQDRSLIADTMMTHAYDRWLDPDQWPSFDELRQELLDFVGRFLDRPNMAEFVFILLRQRRMISPWSQQLTPAGHLVACPYLDLGYLRLLLSYRPADKHRIVYQRQCLERHWPSFARFPGNRSIPSDLPPGDPRVDESRSAACHQQLLTEIRGRGDLIAPLLSGPGRLRWLAIRAFPAARRHSDWLSTPLLELAAREAGRKPCWDIDPQAATAA